MTREGLIEAMARAAFCPHAPPDIPDAGPSDAERAKMRAALAAIEAAGCVVVPRELTDATRRAVWTAQYELSRETSVPEVSDAGIRELVERRIADPAQRASDQAAYRAMLAASPFAEGRGDE